VLRTLASRRRLHGYAITTHIEQVSSELLRVEEGSLYPAGNVRLFEFLVPLLNLVEVNENSLQRVDPDIDVLRFFASPLLKLYREKVIPAPKMDLSALNTVKASVFLLAGYYDHTADYRSQIALASHFQMHHLLLLKDDQGPHRELWALRKTGWLTQNQLEEVNEYIARLIKRMARDKRNGRLYGITVLLTPLDYRSHIKIIARHSRKAKTR
jgi:hypothetical protein